MVDLVRFLQREATLMNSPRDTFAWKRGETTASAGELMAFNGLTAEALCKRGIELVK